MTPVNLFVVLRLMNSPSAISAFVRPRAVDGRAFKNFEGEAGGSPTFADDYAISCNTAFIGLAGRLRNGDLTRVARDYGLGRPPTSAVADARSRVPTPDGVVAPPRP